MAEIQPPSMDVSNQPVEEKSEDYIKVGMSTCGIAAGAAGVFDTLQAEIQKRHLPIKVSKCGCVGRCYAEPMVEIKFADLPVVQYGKVTKEIALQIIDKHLIEKVLLDGYIYESQN